MSTPTPDTHRAVRLGLGLVLLLTVFLTAFTWPVSEVEPRSLPVVTVGPDAVADQVGARLAEQAGPDAFEVTAVADHAAAVDAIENREAYAAVLVSPDAAPEVLLAGAASPMVAQIFTQVAGEMQARVTDVAPAPADDPRRAGFGAGALPLVLGGLLLGALTSLLLPSSRQRISIVLAAAVAGAFAIVGVSQAWLGILDGSYLANAGVVALALAAMGLTIVGLRNVVGTPGIGIGAALLMLVGNPLSGITSAPELLPLGWLGQLLPPGAMGSALRSTAFFDGAGVGVPLLVLGGWAVFGLALALVPVRQAAATPELVDA